MLTTTRERTVSQMGGLITAIRADVGRLHSSWMGLIFPAQESSTTSVLGKWKPQSRRQQITYGGWSIIGYILLLLTYPFAATAALVLLTAQGIDRTAASLGLVGVGGVTLLVWGAFTAAAYVQLPAQGFIAVAAATVVATVSAVLSRLTTRIDGRPVTVAISHPLAVTVLFLPPVTAAIYSPTVAEYVFPRSRSIAIWLLENILWIGNLNTVLQQMFELQGISHIAMWFALAFPVGWILGTVITVISLMRSEDSTGLVT